MERGIYLDIYKSINHTKTQEIHEEMEKHINKPR